MSDGFFRILLAAPILGVADLDDVVLGGCRVDWVHQYLCQLGGPAWSPGGGADEDTGFLRRKLPGGFGLLLRSGGHHRGDASRQTEKGQRMSDLAASAVRTKHLLEIYRQMLLIRRNEVLLF